MVAVESVKRILGRIKHKHKMKGKTMSIEYEKITNKILGALNEGRIPWKRTWNNIPANAITKHQYSGINLLLLAVSDYSSPYFLTYNQAAAVGGNVKRGEHGHTVVFWKLLEKHVEVDGEQRIKRIPLLKTYTVFNLEQCENIDMEKFNAAKENAALEDPEAVIDNYLMNAGPKLEFRGYRPCYRPLVDVVEMPDKKFFMTSEAYYSVMFHELTHSTGHKSRLDRHDAAGHYFGSESYSLEELVAEIGSAFLCSKAGIESVTENTKAYIQSWIAALRNDPRMIVYAAGKAQRAVDRILGTAEVETS
jgi:antirestriction protein ArdC